MSGQKRFVVVAAAGVVALVAIACLGRPWRLSEIRGTLLSEPRAGRIPEDPPVLAYLITPAGTWELDAPAREDCKKWHRLLRNLSGRQVIVRGTRRVRYAADRPSRVHPTILIEELMPAVPVPATAPRPPGPRKAGG